MTKKILICGPIAPPAGGISIHIQRLAELLSKKWEASFIDEAPQIKKGIFNIRSLNPVGYARKIKNCDLLFVHSGNKLFKVIHILAGKWYSKPVLITIHGYGKKRNFLLSRIDRFCYQLADKIILVNKGILQKIALNENKCLVQHAFLPPVMKKELALPAALTSIIAAAKSKNRPVICGNASRLDRFQGTDLYGLDMMLELCLQFKKNMTISPYFIFVVSSLDAGQDLFDQAMQFIMNNQLEQDFTLLHAPISFPRLIEASDIMIRPTATDGDSLSIRESLFLQKITIASDAVSRPSGCISFKSRNHQDLYDVTMQTIQNISGNKTTKVDTPATDDHIQFYEQLFDQLTKPSNDD